MECQPTMRRSSMLPTNRPSPIAYGSWVRFVRRCFASLSGSLSFALLLFALVLNLGCVNGRELHLDRIATLKASALAGDNMARRQLGRIYEVGDGVIVNTAESFKWYLLAAEDGDVDAQFQLGALLDAARNPRDARQAYIWFKKSAVQGNGNAQFNVAQMLESGDGVEQDLAQAAVWYGRAAALGNARAQNNLGNMLRDGRGFAKDLSAARGLYEAAAKANNAFAQFNYGVMLFRGHGGETDYLESYKWLSLAMRGFEGTDTMNYRKAFEVRELLASFMTPSQIRAAEALNPSR